LTRTPNAGRSHTMGTSFVGNVRDVRQIAEAQIGEADMVEFKVQVNGHEATEQANRIQACEVKIACIIARKEMM